LVQFSSQSVQRHSSVVAQCSSVVQLEPSVQFSSVTLYTP